MATRLKLLSGSGFWVNTLRILFVLFFLAGSYFLLRDADQLGDIGKALKQADVGWIIFGLVATALSYLVASLTQYAAGSWQGSFQKIHLIQWVGNFINRFLPLNIGSTALTVRHYRRYGRPTAEAITVATLPSIVGFAKNIIPILILSPFTINNILKQNPIELPSLWVAPIIVAVLLTASFFVNKYKVTIKRFWLEAIGGLSSIKNPWQLAVLISASVTYTLLASASLFAATQAVDVTVALPDIFTLYILSVLAGSALPTPGGVGGTETVLVAGLTALGISLSAAVSITLLFRLMTFWAPIIPGAVALHLFRRKL